MSALITSCRLPAVVATATCRQQPRAALAAPQLQPLRPCSTACLQRATLQQQRAPAGGRRQVAVRAEGTGGGEFKKNTEFGYSRKDVILIGVGLIGGGYVLYYGLQATGMEPGIAGNWVQFLIFMGICVGWVGSYLYRVATKQMTYARQLEDYEEAVMRKRLEEMPEAEVDRILEEIESEKAKRGQK